MAGGRASSWTTVLLVSCLLRAAEGFVGSAGLWRPAETCPAVGTSAGWVSSSSRGSRSSRTSTLHNIIRPRRVVAAASVGVGGLRAALEVQLGQNLEVGSVIVSGRDNYGHMTFKVCVLFGVMDFDRWLF